MMKLNQILKDPSLKKSTRDGLVLMQAMGERAGRIGNLHHLEMKEVNADGSLKHYLFSLPRNKARVYRIKAKNELEYHNTNPIWNEYLTQLLGKAIVRYNQMPRHERHPDGAFLIPGWEGPVETRHVRGWLRDRLRLVDSWSKVCRG